MANFAYFGPILESHWNKEATCPLLNYTLYTYIVWNSYIMLIGKTNNYSILVIGSTRVRGKGWYNHRSKETVVTGVLIKLGCLQKCFEKNIFKPLMGQ